MERKGILIRHLEQTGEFRAVQNSVVNGTIKRHLIAKKCTVILLCFD